MEHPHIYEAASTNEQSAIPTTQDNTEFEHSNWPSLIVEGIEEALFILDREWRFTYVNGHVGKMWGQSPDALVGKVMWDIFPSLLGTRLETFYRQAIHDPQPRRLEEFSVSTHAWYDVRVYPIPQGLIVYFQDITARKQAEAEIQRQAQRAHVQAEVSQALAEATNDYQTTLNTAARQLADVIGDSCVIRLISPDGEWFEFGAFHHRFPEAADILHTVQIEEPYQRVGEELTGQVVLTGQPLFMPNFTSAQAEAKANPKHWPYFDRFNVISALIVPLRATGQVIGVIAMNRIAPSEPYTNDDLLFAQDLADRVAIAITNARLLQQVQRQLGERIQTEAELRRSEERFKILSGATNEALLIHEYGRVVEANQRAAEMLGYESGELIGMPLAALVAPEDTAALRERIASGAEFTTTTTGLHKNGTRLITEVRGRSINYQGRSMRLGAIRDITDLVHAEEALRESEARFTGIVASAMDAIISVDESLRIVVFNTAAEQMFRCSATSVLGQTLEQFLPASARAFHADYIHRFSLTGTTNRSMGALGTLTAIRATGEEFPIEATISQTIVAGQHLYTVIVRDITERKRAEEQLQKTQAQLLQSQKMESIGQLAGGIAHDFNNLLSLILGYCELCMMGLDAADPLYADIQEIRRAGERATTLVRQILAFSRRQLLEPMIMNLNETVANLDKMLHRVIGEDIELVSLLEPNLQPVFVDPGQIEQVIVNLVVNARDAMPDGGQLTIETAMVDLDEAFGTTGHTEVKTGRYVLLAVSDTGIGMDHATQEKIFEPFFTTKEVGKGTGLGLATVYGIVRQSGGLIWVYSEPGVGSTFKIYLPVVADPSLVTSQRLLKLDQAPRQHNTGEGYTILVVEDDISVQQLIRRVLSEAGYATMMAHNGQEALDIITGSPGLINMVLTDVIMPQMSGRGLVERLKERWPEVKILCISGYTNRVVQRHGLIKPWDKFLQKPFTPDSLLHCVEEVLQSV